MKVLIYTPPTRGGELYFSTMLYCLFMMNGDVRQMVKYQTCTQAARSQHKTLHWRDVTGTQHLRCSLCLLGSLFYTLLTLKINFCKVAIDSDKVAHTRISLLVLGLNFVFFGTPGMIYSRANWSLIRSSMYSSLQI